LFNSPRCVHAWKFVWAFFDIAKYTTQSTLVYDRLLAPAARPEVKITYIMELSMGARTVYPTPTAHYYGIPLPLSSYDNASDMETRLVPRPLSRTTTVLSPIRGAYAVVEPQSPIYIPSACSSRTSSLRSSRRSICSSRSLLSSPLSSAPSSPGFPRHSLELTCTSPSTVWYTPVSSPEPQPRRPLRRKTSPTHDTLRNLRAKQSDACLQRVCDEQVLAYLSDTLFPQARARPELDVLDEGD